MVIGGREGERNLDDDVDAVWIAPGIYSEELEDWNKDGEKERGQREKE